MFWTVPVSIIRSFSLYTQQWYMSYRFADSLRAGSGRKFRPDPVRKLSANLYDIYHYCVFSKELLMMDRGTVRNKNKFEKLVHLFGFIKRIYHDARSPERQIRVSFCRCELVDSPASSISVVSLNRKLFVNFRAHASCLIS